MIFFGIRYLLAIQIKFLRQKTQCIATTFNIPIEMNHYTIKYITAQIVIKSKSCYFSVDAQSPKVYITKTNPPTINDDIIIIERDTDLVMDCFVDNLVPGMNVMYL